MTEPIRIHHADTEAEVRDRHERIEKRLNELGIEAVKITEFPTQWAPIIRAWLGGRRLAPAKAPAAPRPGED